MASEDLGLNRCQTCSNVNSMSKRKETWSSSLGFILATAGSAVGLGNLWGFAYRASAGGGAVFIVLFILIIVSICMPVLIAEMVLGRSTGSAALMAPTRAGGRRWALMGWWGLINCLGILSYYSVIMGWTMNSLITSILEGLPQSAEAGQNHFNQISSGSWSLIGHLISIVVTGFVVSAGVQKGIERLSKWGIPTLFLLLVGLMIWAGTLPNAMEGYKTFLLKWDSAMFLDRTTLMNAFTQAFFSLGLGVGVITTYASYLGKGNQLPKEASWIAGMDTSVGIMAGCVTFPLVASAGLQDMISDSNVGALFIAVPSGLASIPMGGRLITALFFALVYIAGLTSIVSILEAPVASIIERFGWSRQKAVWSLTIICACLGIPAALNSHVLESMDAFFASFGMISGGLLVILLMGWSVPKQFNNDLKECGTSPLIRRLLLFSLRWFSPAVVSIGLLISLSTLKDKLFGA